jgi:EpsI family protein
MKYLRLYLVYALLILSALFIALHQDNHEPTLQPLTSIPLNAGGWAKVDETYFSEAVLKVLRPTAYLYRVYADDAGHRVSLYIGYHGGGADSGPIHSPKHCLPGSGWHSLSETTTSINVAGKPVSVVEAEYQNGSQRELFLYWFQVKGQTLTNEYSLKFAEITNSILYSRRDSAFVRISVPHQEGDDTAIVIGEQFVRTFYPYIEAVLPK